MTLKELKEKVYIGNWCGYGSYRIEIEYRGKNYYCVTHNTLATDRIKARDYVGDRVIDGWYTLKQAYQSLYDEVKRDNNL